MTYEMRFGADGDMPEAQFTDAYVAVWDMYQSGQKEKARTAFASLLLMLNQMRQFRGVPQYMMKKRGVFKTMVSRGHDGKRLEFQLKPDEMAEIDWNFRGHEAEPENVGMPWAADERSRLRWVPAPSRTCSAAAADLRWARWQSRAAPAHCGTPG